MGNWWGMNKTSHRTAICINSIYLDNLFKEYEKLKGTNSIPPELEAELDKCYLIYYKQKSL